MTLGGIRIVSMFIFSQALNILLPCPNENDRFALHSGKHTTSIEQVVMDNGKKVDYLSE